MPTRPDLLIDADDEPPLVETLAEDPRWEAAGLEPLAERAARATLGHLGLVRPGYEISCLGCSDKRIAVLNADFRGKPQPTNVLSWPSAERAAARPGLAPALPGPCALGDIALAWETCVAEAEAEGKPFEQHVTHLLVHGVLHLLGYDHDHDADALLMERTEAAILAGLGLPDPYQDQSHAV